MGFLNAGNIYVLLTVVRSSPISNKRRGNDSKSMFQSQTLQKNRRRHKLLHNDISVL